MVKTEDTNGATTEKVDQIVEQIKKLTVIELAALVKVLEDTFGVTAATPVVPAVAVSTAGAGEESAVEEQTEFDVVLTSFGEKKIQVIKVVRALTGLGLKEAKALVESVPTAVKEGLSKDEADKIKTELEEAGATVELK